MGKPAKSAFDAQVFLAKVGEGKSILQFKKGQNVFVQDDRADTVFYNQKGRIKLTVLSDQGKEAVVGILSPGQFFGEGCMNGHKLRISTTTAMENCVITAITKTAMIAALHDEPQFSEMFMAYLLTRNSRIERPDRPIVQFERETACAPAVAAGSFREGRQPATDQSKHQSGNAGGDDRHHPIPRQLFHEQVSQTWAHRLQRTHRGSQFAVERSLA
jgi:hypothetical protein